MFKNRVNDEQWHDMRIIDWFKSKKAVKTSINNFRMNMKLNPNYVKIKNCGYMRVWGAYINWTADNNLKTAKEYKNV